MFIIEKFLQPSIPASLHWFNPPAQFKTGNGMEIVTAERTDFWQRTHYGFQNDNGHCLFASLTGDFSMTTCVSFEPRAQYDQCGLMLRLDAENWIKTSSEYESQEHSRLGSVVTNLGYSDWATQDISSAHKEMWYRISRKGADFLVEHAYDGHHWQQLRVAHLHLAADTIEAGPYACSPIGKEFWCRFSFLEISSSQWK
jgi:uncharacterized protein